MKYDIHFSIAGIIIYILLLFILGVLYRGNQGRVRKLRQLIITLLVTDVLDVVSAYTINYHEVVPVWINYVLNGAFFIFEGVCMAMFARYVRDVVNLGKNVKKPIDYINYALTIIFCLLCATSVFTKLIFYFEGTKYHKGPLYNLTFGLGAYFLIFSFIILVKHRKTFSNRQFYSIVAFIGISLAGAALQFFMPGSVFVLYFGFSVASVIAVFGLETPDFFKLQSTLDELEKSQEELKAALERAEGADRAKSDFLANMSHEIRTPINAVLGMNEIIRRESNQSEIQSYSANIAEAGQSLLSLINDILDFSKIEAGKMELSKVEYKLSNLIREVNNIIGIRCDAKGLNFEIKNNPDIPNMLCGDDVRIRQILLNLLNNSLKYTEKGTVSLLIDYVEADDSSIELIMAVKDTGIGIKEADLPALFESFKRIDLEHNRKREGTGLGLNITQSFVEMMDGHIDVESVYGEGSTFTVHIIQKVIDKEKVGAFERLQNSTPKKEKYQASFTAPAARLLVVDDVKMNLSVAKGLLKQTEMTVDTALSGAECLKMVAENEYDIIFLDHMMPEMDGLETMKRFKEDKKHCNQNTPVVMLTANAILGAKEEYINSGFNDYLSKPIQWKEMEAMIVKYLPAEKLIAR